MSDFRPEFFVNNRAKLRTLFSGTAPIVITANGLLQRSADTEYPFRQDSNFWYLTGINEPDVILVIDKSREYLIVPERGQERSIFDGAIDKTRLSAVSGITTVFGSKDGWKRLGTRLKRAKHVATLTPLPAYLEERGLYINPARARLIDRINSINKVELIDLRPQLASLRMLKTAEELIAIKRAVMVTTKAMQKVKKTLNKLSFEYEAEAILTREFRRQNLGHAYQPIVASGPSACTLHYINNSAAINPKDLLLIDVGAEVQNYAADLTRTYAINEPSKRQKAVHQAVCEVQDFAFSLLKPGVLIKAYEKQVEHFMGEKLRELGLIKTITRDSVRKFSPHAASHFLGLDVHDSANYKRPLEAGMALTVEPGIYIPKEGIGVRIEDNVLITQDGLVILSKSLPRDL